MSSHFPNTLSLPNPSSPHFEVLVPINWVGVGTNTETSYNVSELGLFLRLFLYLCRQERWNGPMQSYLYKHLKKIQWSLFKGKELEHLQNYNFKNAYKHHTSLLSDFCLFFKILFLCLPLAHNQYGASQRPVNLIKLRHSHNKVRDI